MHHRPKLEPPLLLSLALLLLPLVHGYPTINQGNPQQNSYVQSLDKMFAQPVQLEDTIQEVQQILARDPSLPRLTRGEIEELYEKVTREEYQKSIAAGDTGRADSMRALMLVLPYNTDNNTEQNLQELYTRPPVTKVIDGYTPPHPIKFITPDPSSLPKADTMSVGKLDATTYKPFFALKTAPALESPTTYHPPAPPPVMYQMTPSVPASIMQFQPVTNGPLVFDYGTNLERSSTPKPAQRFSSHYSAKNTQFLKQPAAQRKPRPTTSTVRPVADVLESLGIVGQTQSRKRFTIDDYYAAESAPQPVVSAYLPQLPPQIRADAYTSFKPLNIGEEIRAKPEVEDYLTRFGIVGGRRRKALKKKGSVVEQQSAESEIATAKVPPSSAKARKGVQGGGATELDKLLENLQELERLNLNAKATAAAAATATTTTKKATTTTTSSTARPSSSSTTTATATTNAPPSSLNLITNGAPLLVEPKKPRRRIDPHIDINFAAASNKHTEQSSGDQLSKLLENLQELEKLRGASATAPKAVTKPLTLATSSTTTTTTTTTTAAPQLLSAHSQTVTNRFNEPLLQLQLQQLQQLQRQQQQQVQRSKPSQQGELQELQRVLKQLQAAEQANARSTTTTKAPSLRPNFGLNDFSQLRKLLTDDRELERLYEQARGKRPGATTPSTTTSTTTTRKPSPSLGELEQLQKYLAAFERNRSVTPPTTTTSSSTTTTTAAPTTTSSTSTSTSTSTTTSTTTTTTTTTPRPATASADFSQRIAASATASPKKPAAVDNAQLQELISRVQQLERQSSRPAALDGFSSRNVNAPQATPNDLRVPTNDFAQLQQLYQQVAQAEQASFGRIEISTAATAAKTSSQQQQQQQQKAAQRTQHFAQRIIDITNDTGSGSSLQEVDPHDFVQLQKLLRKVQELERVRILPNELAAAPIYVQPPQAVPTPTQLPSFVTAASFQSAQAVPQLIYPEQSRKQPPVKSSAPKYTELDELRLDLPVYQSSSTRKPATAGSNSAPSSSEELRDFVLAKPANPQSVATTDAEFEQYQQFFSHLEDTERNSYQKMQPPMIQKTLPVTKQPPLSIATRKPEELAKQRLAAANDNENNNNNKQADLAQLQILLNNAQELEKLGITLPQQLSVQIENKLTQSGSSAETGYKKTPLSGNEPRTTPTLAAAPTPPAAKPTSLATVDRVAAAEVQQYLNGDDLLDSGEQKLSSTTTKAESTSVESEEDPSEKTVVFSVTTMKSLTPKTPRPTSESTLELPIISYNKVIEAAVRQAASKFGYSTEQTLGFRRRSDDDVEDMATDNADLMGEFSEINYQLAQPDASLELAESAAAAGITEASIATNATTTAAATPADELSELQRLIGNLQELQRLNLNASPELLRKADAMYLESFKRPDGSVTDDDTKKSRRQSATPSTSTVTAAPSTESSTQEADAVNAAVEPSTESDVAAASPAAVESESTTAAPTRINLDLSLANSDADDDAAPASEASSTASASSTEDSATEEPRNGSLADLEASFGPDPNTETPLPPKKKNGFYFLADWNSFLEVGDGDDQVVVRFSPKIGDPRLFIPVKIP